MKSDAHVDVDVDVDADVDVDGSRRCPFFFPPYGGSAPLGHVVTPRDSTCFEAEETADCCIP